MRLTQVSSQAGVSIRRRTARTPLMRGAAARVSRVEGPWGVRRTPFSCLGTNPSP